jgi:ribosome-associated toxin RatA of RatAB toxin-antitoxin module
MKRATAVVAVALGLLLRMATAAAAPPDSAAPLAVQFEFRDLGPGLVFVRARADLPCAPPQAYDVVADFDHIADYASAVDSSAVVGRDSSAVVVRQVGRTRFFLARQVRLTLRFVEAPPHLLRFEIAGGDFRVYYGSWRFEPQADGTRLVYAVTFEPPAWLPRPLLRHVMERDLRALMPEIAAEIRRRGVTAPESAVPPTRGSPR